MGFRAALFLTGLASIGFGLILMSQNSIVIDHSAAATSIPVVQEAVIDPNADIEPQPQLANPPSVIKAIYATSWAAGSETKLSSLIKLIKDTELNAIVIDVKDFSGYVAYNTDLALPKQYNAVELRIPKLNKLIKRLHDENIYVIGRISTFEDNRLALARPEIALMSSSTGKTWQDSKGLMWIDPSSKEAWDYNISIAKEILSRGFDEANFDYVRFASDGKLNDIKFPIWDEKKLKVLVIKDFFDYLHGQITEGKVSADIFGLATINHDGVGIGQHLEYILPNFDAVAPMVYPSHYATGFIGYKNPADYPYEVIKYSMDRAVARETNLSIIASTTPMAKLRPWIQDFSLGATYDAAKVRAEIQAWNDAASGTPEFNGGWMLWNAANNYTKGALELAPVVQN